MELGDISDILVWAAATSYTIAMIAFALDMARQSGRSLEQKERALVGAGAPAEATVAPALGHVEPRRNVVGIALSTSWLGLALHLAAVVARGIAAGRAPWANMYEFTLVGALIAMGVFLVVQLRRDFRFVGVVVTGLSVSALMVALNAFHVEAAGVAPALQSYWLVIHVGVAVGATGVFAVAFAVSVVQLLKDSRDSGSPLLNGQATGPLARVVGRPRQWAWLDTVPTPNALEALSFRINAFAFVLWTFTLIGGSIWAENAWGRYWGWDPKEVWSFVVWVVYAAYLHARTTRGWAGRRAAWFVVVGFACVLFNFTGVNLLFSGKHAYSGI